MIRINMIWIEYEFLMKNVLIAVFQNISSELHLNDNGILKASGMKRNDRKYK